MRAMGFNYVSIHARNLEESTRFYVGVFGMEKIPTYTFAFPVQYLRLNKGAGEGGRMLTPAILSAAIEDALEPYGARITSLPISAEQIVEWAAAH